MKVSAVRTSQLVVEKRWDVPLHIVLSELRERVDELRQTVPADVAIARLGAILPSDKSPLLALARGRNLTPAAATIDRVVREYPHLALALMEKNADPAIERALAGISKNAAVLTTLLTLGAPASLPR